MIFVNQSYIDYEKKEISIINVFGKKTIYQIKDINILEFYYQKYFWSKGFYYKIILKHENLKFVIMSGYMFKNEINNVCEFLNNFQNFNMRK
jgi:hypothetical protein